MAELRGLSRGERLGSGYYRIVFGRTRATRDTAWLRTMDRIHTQLPSSRIAFPVSPKSTGANDSTAVIDVKPTSTGSQRTVAELVNVLEDLVDTWGTDEANVRSIERVASVGSGAVVERDRAVEEEKQRLADERAAGPLGQLLARLRTLGGVVYWLVILALVAGAGILVYRLYAASKVAGVVARGRR